MNGDASFGEISVYTEVVTKPWSDDGGSWTDWDMCYRSVTALWETEALHIGM